MTFQSTIRGVAMEGVMDRKIHFFKREIFGYLFVSTQLDSDRIKSHFKA